MPSPGVCAQLLNGEWRAEMAKWCHLRIFPLRGSSFNAKLFSVLRSEVLGRKLIDLFSKFVTETITTNAVEMLCKYSVHLTTLPVT